MSSGWRNTLALAATAALSLGSPDQAQAQDLESIWPYYATKTVQAIPVSDYPAISPELLDPGAVDNRELQKAIIDDAARGHSIASAKFEVGLSTDAAYTLTRARNQGDLPGAREGQSPADWWREAEPVIFEKMEDYKAERRLPYLISAGLVGAMGLGIGGSAALSAYRRRKEGAQSHDDRPATHFRPPTGPG